MPSLGQIKVTAIDAETGIKQLDVVTDALRSIAEAGLQFPTKPTNGFDGTVSKAITDLDDDELGDMLQKLNVWCGFVEAEDAKTESELEVAQAQYEFIQSHVRIALKYTQEGRMTTQDKTDAIRNDERVSTAHSKYLFHFTKFNVLKALRNTSQRSWETVSRRITQRGQDIERLRRGETVNSPSPLTARNPFKR